MNDKDFREAAKRAFLSEREAAALLRTKVMFRLWRERTFDEGAMWLDYLALSQAVENRNRVQAKRWDNRLKLVLDFIEKLRFW